MEIGSNEQVSIRTMDDSLEDKSLLLQWLNTPEVTDLAYRENVPWTMEKIEREFGPRLHEDEEVTACIIEHERQPIGYLQFYPLAPESYQFSEAFPFEEVEGGYGLDLFIGLPHLWGQGLGSQAVNLVCEYLFQMLGARLITADPEDTNVRSIRLWLKCGFKPAAKLPDYDDPELSSVLMIRRKEAKAGDWTTDKRPEA